MNYKILIENTVQALLNEAYFDRNDVVAAHYLWNAHHHGGQSSPEYARLSKIGSYYKPGMTVRNDDFENENQAEIYGDLCGKAGCTHGTEEEK